MSICSTSPLPSVAPCHALSCGSLRQGVLYISRRLCLCIEPLASVTTHVHAARSSLFRASQVSSKPRVHQAGARMVAARGRARWRWRAVALAMVTVNRGTRGFLLKARDVYWRQAGVVQGRTTLAWSHRTGLSMHVQSVTPACGPGGGNQMKTRRDIAAQELEGVFAAVGDADNLSLEQVEEILTRLARCAQTVGGARINDGRFEALLRRIVVLAPTSPVRWVPEVLKCLAKVTSPSHSTSMVLVALQLRLDMNLADLGPVALCQTAFTFSRLRFTPVGGAVWWKRFVESCANQLISFSPWQLSTLLRSLTAQTVPREAYLDAAFLGLSIKCAQRRIFSFQHYELEALAAALSKIGQFWRPSTQFLDQLSASALGVLPEFRPLGLARMLHALSRMDYDPGAPFRHKFESRCVETASKWDQSSIALIFQSFSWLKTQPSDELYTALMERARVMLTENAMSPLNLGTLLVALGDLKRCPDTEFMEAYVRAAYLQLPLMGPKDLSYVLKGFGKLHYFPGEEFLHAHLARMGALMAEYNSIDLQFIITSLIGLAYVPPPSFQVAFQVAALTRLPSTQPRDLALIVWSTQALGFPSSEAFVQELLSRACQQLEREVEDLGALREKRGMEKWHTLARLRQLRQVAVHLHNKSNRSSESLCGVVSKLLPMLEKALEAVSDNELVRSRALISPFHVEVRSTLEAMGGRIENQMVDVFIVDTMLHSLSGEQKPVAMLLHGPSRFIRNQSGKVEAGTAFKERVLRGLPGFAAVVPITHHEWAEVKTIEERRGLIRSRLEAAGVASADYLQPEGDA